MELYLGGVKYRAPYGANNLDKKETYCEGRTTTTPTNWTDKLT